MTQPNPTPPTTKREAPLFSYEIVKNANQEPSLWNRFRLLFRPVNKAIDIVGDKKLEMWFKELDGVNYITNIWYSEKP